MSVLVIEHVAAEGPYAIGTALENAGRRIQHCRVWDGDEVPGTLDGAEGLVVMGGPMAAHSDRGFPSRGAELKLLRMALDAGVPTLGVCLGAQLLAQAAGGATRPGSGPHVGWGSVRIDPAARSDALLRGLPGELRVLHWHSDTMDLPPSGTTLLASCDRYPVQAFRAGHRAWGFQFHLEVDAEAVSAFAAAFPEDAATAPGLLEHAATSVAALAPHRQSVLTRFAALTVTHQAALT